MRSSWVSCSFISPPPVQTIQPCGEASDSDPGSPLAAIPKDWTVLQAREYVRADEMMKGREFILNQEFNSQFSQPLSDLSATQGLSRIFPPQKWLLGFFLLPVLAPFFAPIQHKELFFFVLPGDFPQLEPKPQTRISRILLSSKVTRIPPWGRRRRHNNAEVAGAFRFRQHVVRV